MSQRRGARQSFWKKVVPLSVRLARDERKVSQWYSEAREGLEESKAPADEFRSLEGMFADEMISIEAQRKARTTRKLMRVAYRFHLPTPSSEAWETDRMTGVRYLSDDGLKQLREEVRREQRWAMERRKHYMGWLAALTGLLGALIGVLAFLRG